jgi:hypothetical protein
MSSPTACAMPTTAHRTAGRTGQLDVRLFRASGGTFVRNTGCQKRLQSRNYRALRVGKRGVEPPDNPCKHWAVGGWARSDGLARGTSRYVAGLTRHRVGHVPPEFHLMRAWSALASEPQGRRLGSDDATPGRLVCRRPSGSARRRSRPTAERATVASAPALATDDLCANVSTQIEPYVRGSIRGPWSSDAALVGPSWPDVPARGGDHLGLQPGEDQREYERQQAARRAKAGVGQARARHR